jgi:hypothetical protein
VPAGFDPDHGSDELQVVLDPVHQLLHQRHDARVRDRALALEPRALGDVLDRQQDLLCLLAVVINLARIEHHHPPADRRKHVVDLECLDGRGAGDDRLERGAELGNVPLPGADLIELAADGGLRRNRECAAERMVRKPDGEIRIEDEQAFPDRVHKIQRVDALLLRTPQMTGSSLHSTARTDLAGEPRQPSRGRRL